MRARRGPYPELRWFEDFASGQRFEFGAWEIRRDEVLAFARRYDPEPYHVDEAAARALGWRGLVAPGTLVGAIWRRLSKDAFPNAQTVVSPGWDTFRWLEPVYVGDVLTSRSEITQTRGLNSRPGEGLVKMRNEMVRAGGEVVTLIVANWFVRRRRPEP